MRAAGIGGFHVTDAGGPCTDSVYPGRSVLPLVVPHRRTAEAGDEETHRRTNVSAFYYRIITIH